MVNKGGYSKEGRYEGLSLEYYVELEGVILSMRLMRCLGHKVICQADGKSFLSRCGEKRMLHRSASVKAYCIVER